MELFQQQCLTYIRNKTKILQINRRLNCSCNVVKIDKFISHWRIEAKTSNSSLVIFRNLNIMKIQFQFYLKLVSIDTLFEIPKCYICLRNVYSVTLDELIYRKMANHKIPKVNRFVITKLAIGDSNG